MGSETNNCGENNMPCRRNYFQMKQFFLHEVPNILKSHLFVKQRITTLLWWSLKILDTKITVLR